MGECSHVTSPVAACTIPPLCLVLSFIRSKLCGKGGPHSVGFAFSRLGGPLRLEIVVCGRSSRGSKGEAFGGELALGGEVDAMCGDLTAIWSWNACPRQFGALRRLAVAPGGLRCREIGVTRHLRLSSEIDA